jgi:hypothetical protein
MDVMESMTLVLFNHAVAKTNTETMQQCNCVLAVTCLSMMLQHRNVFQSLVVQITCAIPETRIGQDCCGSACSHTDE